MKTFEKYSLVLPIGPAGCGKSYLGELGVKAGFWSLVSSDAIRGELYGDESLQKDHAQVFDVVHKRVSDILDKRKTVYVDATNLVPKYRKTLIDIAKEHDAELMGIVYTGDVVACLERNRKRDRQVPEQVITVQYDTLHRPGYFPTLEEGFDIITTMAFEEELLTQELALQQILGEIV